MKMKLKLMKPDLNTLSPLPRNILEHLPTAPNGLSLAELADGLLGRTDPASRGKIKAALRAIAQALAIDPANLEARRGMDDLGHAHVVLYGLPQSVARRVRKAFKIARHVVLTDAN